VARGLATSGEAAKQTLNTAPDASPPLHTSALSIAAGLDGHDLNGLRRQWRGHLGGEPPIHLPRWLLTRVLAYRLQANAFGGLDKSNQRMLRSKGDVDSCIPFDRRSPQTRDGVGLKAGTLLTRGHRQVATRRARADYNGCGFSSGCDDLAPRAHRRGAEHAV
jgi:Protein of unknown function (DUF2924)